MKIFYLVTLMSVGLLASAQVTNPGISGTLAEQNGEPAAFVVVALLNKDSAVVKTEVSGTDGHFQFVNIKTGQYRVATSSLQFKPYKSDLFNYDADQPHHIGKISLEASVTELKEVTIIGAKQMVEIHPDKTVFNVQGTINSSGNDGLDLLSKAPGIMLDNNENLVVMGKMGVLIFIDGKRIQLRGDDLTTMLRGLRSENIEAIEIITNPSAKYDAEGNAGIINIRLKRDASLGWNGNVVLGYAIDLHSRHNGGVTFNNRTKKLNLYGSASAYDNKGEWHINLNRLQNDYLMQNRTVNLWHTKGLDTRLGTDFFIGKKHTIGVLATSTLTDRNTSSDARTPIRNAADNSIDQMLIAQNKQQFDIVNRAANFNYQFKGNAGTTFNVDADYGYYKNLSDALQPNSYYNGNEETFVEKRTNRNDRSTTIYIKTLKSDYEKNLGKGKFGVGFKISSVKTENILLFSEWIDDNPPTGWDNDFDYTENIYAGYANYAIKFAEKFNLNLGVRSETTKSLGELTSSTENTEDDRVDRSYTDLFPNSGFTVDVNKKNKIGVSYSRRIDRPNYQNLNPFEYKLDELNFMKGNPFLKPQYTNNFQLTYSWNTKLNVIAGYSITRDVFAMVLETVDEKGSRIRPQNLADGYNTSLNISYPFDITNWWNLRANTNIFYTKYKAFLDNANIDLDVVTYNLSFQSTMTLPHDFKAEVSAWYNSPSIWQGTVRASYIWSSTIGIRKTVFKNGQLTASLNDVFNTQRWYTDANYGGQKVDGTGRFNFRRFIVGFNYRFGNQKAKGPRNRKSGLEDEKNRLSDGQ
jgi:iron complex outermembrane recepter protein